LECITIAQQTARAFLIHAETGKQCFAIRISLFQPPDFPCLRCSATRNTFVSTGNRAEPYRVFEFQFVGDERT
jgi:hypothetical protein